MLTGIVGSIKWQYYTAAAVNGYTVACSKAGEWRLTATVVLSDAFKMSQRPLTFVAPHTKKGPDGATINSEWRWPIRTLTINGPTLTATLGPPES